MFRFHSKKSAVNDFRVIHGQESLFSFCSEQSAGCFRLLQTAYAPAIAAAAISLCGLYLEERYS